jgi:hypothetical protein
MKVYAEICTPWAGDGLTLETAFRPLLKDFYAFDFRDTTSQEPNQLPPKPNLFVIYVDIEELELSGVQADSRFYVLYVGDGQNEEPPANEFGKLRSYLGKNGVDQEDITAAIGSSSGGRDRGQITKDLKAWLRTLNRA